jgi:hypothetical protein
LNEGV